MYKDLRKKTTYPQDLLKFTNLNFVDKMRLDVSIFNNNLDIDRMGCGGQYTKNEKNFLFNFVKNVVKPKGILEFSPFCGYTTMIMGSAIKNIPGFKFFKTYELLEECCQYVRRNLEIVDLKNIDVVCGDVFENIKEEDLKECDLLFIDSDHSGEFCERYAKQFLPLLKKGCFVFVHDVWFDPINPETQVVINYIKENGIEDYIYLQDLLKIYGVSDLAPNPFNPKDMEPTTTLVFRK